MGNLECSLFRILGLNIDLVLFFRKKPPKPDTSLEERIRQLTCDVDETSESNQALERRNSPTGEENPQPQNTKYVPDKSFSPISTASSSSSSSMSAYKKITDIFHKDKQRQERIPEADENPIVIIPQVSIISSIHMRNR